MVLPHYGGVTSQKASSYATALQDHWFWLGTWCVCRVCCNLPGKEVLRSAFWGCLCYLFEPYAEISKANVFCVLLCLKWYSLVSCLLYVYTNLWWCHMHVSAKCFVLGLEGTVQVCGRFLWGQLWCTVMKTGSYRPWAGVARRARLAPAHAVEIEWHDGIGWTHAVPYALLVYTARRDSSVFG